MAIVDLNTKKIYGCKEFTPTWWHEKGHIAFNNTTKGISINYYQTFFLMWAVFFIGLSQLLPLLFIKIFGFSLSLLVIIYYFYEEIWCWIYAYNKIKKPYRK